MTAFFKKKPAIWFPAIKADSGADTFTEQLATGLQKHGIRAEITWLPHHAEYLPWMIKKPSKPDWANIIHVNTWLPPYFLSDDTPIVANVHLCVQDIALSPYKSVPQKLYHQLWVTPIEREIIKRAARVIAVSQYTAEKVVSFFGVDNVQYIYNGVDTQIFKPGEYKQQSSVFRLLYAGNHSSRKGFNVLPEIMQQLGADFELYYTAGRNSESYNLPENMHALPRLDYPIGMVKAYQNADALLFPTRLEGFGLVAAEAMACGLPVVASNNSALPEVVEHEVSGLLCPPDDINAFVEAIRQLAHDSKRKKAMATAARQSVETKFRLDTMIEKYIQIYFQILFHD